MSSRRSFLAGSGASLAVLVSGGWGPRERDSTWLVYAPNLEQFWANLPFLERLKKLSEAGLTRYEFGRWKTKDTQAITKANENLGLQTTIFNGYPGLKGAKWKEGLLDASEDSASLAPDLGAVKAGVIPPDRDEKVDRLDQVEDLVDALKEAIEKLGDSEVVLILEPVKAVANQPSPLIRSIEEAVEVIRRVASDRVKFAFPIEKAAVLAGTLLDPIIQHKDRVGYYRLVNFVPPAKAEELAYARVLRAIHDTGHADPIGLGLAPKGDPSAAIEAIRKLDDAAKAL